MKYEIWIGNDASFFDHGVAVFDDGHTEPLETFCNVGIRQDSLMIGTEDEYGELNDKLRWYTMPGVIDFYTWSKSLESIIFHNDSDHEIYICDYAYLMPGESTEIKNYVGRKHAYWLRHMQPVALGRLIETSHPEKEYQRITGRYGLVLSRMSHGNPNKTVIRFVLAEALRGELLETEGFETGAGELIYEEDGIMVLETDNARYVFACDNRQ